MVVFRRFEDDMAEANLAASSSNNPTPGQFIILDQFHQREAYTRLYEQHMLCKAEGLHTVGLQPVKSQGEGGLVASSAIDQTLVGRQLKNANDAIASLIESVKDKDVLIDELYEKINDLSRDLKDRDKKLLNATLKKDEVEKTKTKLSECEEKCGHLTIQVRNLLDEIKDRDIKIHSMAQCAQRRQEHCDEEFALLEEQLADVREENAILIQQIEEEIGRNQIFRDWLNNARRYLRQGELLLPQEEPLPQEDPPLPEEEPLLAQAFDLPEAEVIPHTLE